MSRLHSSIFILTACLGIASAHASLVVTPGVDNAGTDEVLSNACDNPFTGPALTVWGCLNDDHAQNVVLTGDEPITYSGGQAVVNDSDGNGFNSLRIILDGLTFSKLVLNIDALAVASGDAQTVTFTDGVLTSPVFQLDANGQNFFTITGGPFSFIQLNTALNGDGSIDTINDVKQIRMVVAGVRQLELPAPDTLLLLGLGLTALGLVRTSRR